MAQVNYVGTMKLMSTILPRFTAEGMNLPPSGLPQGAERQVGHLTVYSGGKS